MARITHVRRMPDRRAVVAAMCGAVGAVAGCQSVRRRRRLGLGDRVYFHDAPVSETAMWPTRHGTSTRTGSLDRNLGVSADGDVTQIGPNGRQSQWGIVASRDHIVYPVTGVRVDIPGAPAGSAHGVIGTKPEGESWFTEDAGGPLLAIGRTVICSFGDGVAALDASDGTMCWRYNDGQYPTLAGGLVCTTSGHTLFGLDPCDGRRRWKTENFSDGTRFEYTVSKLAGDDELLCGVRTIEYDADSLVAFDPATGAVRWRGDTGPCRHPPVVGDERVYTLSAAGTLTSFSRQGDRLWARGASGESLPAVSDGRLWSAAPAGTILVRDAATGREQWRTTVGDVRPSRPLLTPSAAYVLAGERGGETRLVVIDRQERVVRRRQSVPIRTDQLASGVVPPLATLERRIVVGKPTRTRDDTGGVYVVT